ncbi:MAG: nitrilase-related carbon-nitrogen hydrolase, partial [Desulfurobacteriaceae bacterium]
QWGRARREHWEVLTTARAIEMQRFLVVSNGSGEMAGCSAIIDPWGRILAKAYDGMGIISANVELSRIEQVEKKLPL